MQFAALSSAPPVDVPFSKPGIEPAGSKKKQKAEKTGPPSWRYIEEDFLKAKWNTRMHQYEDVVWTPKVMQTRQKSQEEEWSMVRGIYKAVKAYGGGPVGMS